MRLHVSSTCAHHQEVKIALHSLWCHHTYRWPSGAQVERGCVMQFWPPDDEHMCSKYVEAWNKLIVKQKFCASIWLITEIVISFYFCVWERERERERERGHPVVYIKLCNIYCAPTKYVDTSRQEAIIKIKFYFTVDSTYLLWWHANSSLLLSYILYY